MNIFDLIKVLYLKKPIKYDELKALEVKDCVLLMNFLTQDVNNLEILKKAIGYLFNIGPVCFFVYLYCQIPKSTKVPFLKIPKKAEKEEDELFNKMKYVMGWSSKELKANKEFIEKIVDFDREHFLERLGIENKKEKS